MADNGPAQAVGEAVDWLGRPVSCKDCPHESMRTQGRCDLGRICVRDRRSKRIDRFFASNPLLANRYLQHPYFELRVLAAKHASVFLLPRLIGDDEPDVRAMVAYRLPVSRIAVLKNDPDRKVRLAVAQRVEGQDLIDMLADEDYAVRIIAAFRAPADVLAIARADTEPEVRRIVARRIVVEQLPPMMFDPDPLVRIEVAQRLAPGQLGVLVHDSDLRVRFIVAERCGPELLPYLIYDRDPEVQAAAERRTAELEAGKEDADGPRA
jgi:hypothetical protein